MLKGLGLKHHSGRIGRTKKNDRKRRQTIPDTPPQGTKLQFSSEPILSQSLPNSPREEIPSSASLEAGQLHYYQKILHLLKEENILDAIKYIDNNFSFKNADDVIQFTQGNDEIGVLFLSDIVIQIYLSSTTLYDACLNAEAITLFTFKTPTLLTKLSSDNITHLAEKYDSTVKDLMLTLKSDDILSSLNPETYSWLGSTIDCLIDNHNLSACLYLYLSPALIKKANLMGSQYLSAESIQDLFFKEQSFSAYPEKLILIILKTPELLFFFDIRQPLREAVFLPFLGPHQYAELVNHYLILSSNTNSFTEKDAFEQLAQGYHDLHENYDFYQQRYQQSQIASGPKIQYPQLIEFHQSYLPGYNKTETTSDIVNGNIESSRVTVEEAINELDKLKLNNDKNTCDIQRSFLP